MQTLKIKFNRLINLSKNTRIRKILILLFIVRVSFLSISCSHSETKKPSYNYNNSIISNISVMESYKLIEVNNTNKDFVIIDMRTPGEYNSGYIKNAINIDFYNPKFLDNLNKLDKSLKYLIYCRTANRSGKALLIMQGLGFNEVYNMLGGITDWKTNNYPIVN